MKVYIETYGCQMNKYDSEIVSSLLIEKGNEIVEEWRESDAILINTCAVREHAEERVFSRIGIFEKYKRDKKPNLIIGVMGCIAQEKKENLIKRFSQVDLVIGTHKIGDIPDILSKNKRKFAYVEEDNGYIPLTFHRKGKISSFVAIMRGCNKFCSYCIVPYVRGRERSRNLEDILKEVSFLIQNGAKEITLLGQNVNSYYGFSIEKNSFIDFADLLYELNKIEGLSRIRFTTSNPRDFNEKMIYAIRDLDKVCEHIHIPVQSGSNRILHLMRRGYKREDYLKLVEKIRKEIPDVSLTTDIMVGFPTETEKDFLETENLLKEVKFDTSYIFKYSPRPFTLAYKKFPDDIPEEVKKERLNVLLEMQKEITEKKYNSLVGKKVEVLFEREEKGKYLGKTRTHRTVLVDSRENLYGKLKTVKITSNRKGILEGEVSSEGKYK